MSKGGIYVIVWNVYDIDSLARAEHWLQLLISSIDSNHLIKQTTILFVATHVNSEIALARYSYQVDYLKQHSLYDQLIKEFLPVDSYSDLNSIQLLRRKLFFYATNHIPSVPLYYQLVFDTVKNILPHHHPSSSSSLSSSYPPVVSFSSLSSILLKFSFSIEQLMNALSFFHNNGLIVYIHDPTQFYDPSTGLPLPSAFSSLPPLQNLLVDFF